MNFLERQEEDRSIHLITPDEGFSLFDIQGPTPKCSMGVVVIPRSVRECRGIHV